ncbi:MAG TPA: PEP/pyruvate-binding domain-containing protein [Candidatus Ozemobacteraceae bacterium]|nr:PEP/pyruvate-binding domain-containing protein [Candidatus Ozemobacteraceae bacterium]
MRLICRRLSQFPAAGLAGGKAQGLKLAMDAGLRIPLTWVISVEHSSEVSSSVPDASSLTPLLDEVLHDLQRAGTVSLAVRSSALAEDGRYVSFAGQWRSYARVPLRIEAVVDALRGVFAAGGSASLREYADQFGISLAASGVAALIQPWVDARVSGAAFSVNPLTGERQIIAEAVAGTAEALMGGCANPQRYLLTEGTHCTGEGEASVLLAPSHQTILKSAVEKLERAAGWPVDIEWAMDAEGLVILQVRPVTAFAVPPSPRIAWSRELTAERYPQPLSPLGWTNIKAVFEEGVRSFADFMGMPLEVQTELAAIVDGWVVANPEAFDFKQRFRLQLKADESVQVLGVMIRYGLSRWRTAGLRALMADIKELRRCLVQQERVRTRLGQRPGRLAHVVIGTALSLYLRRVADEVRTEWPAVLQQFRDEVAAVETALTNTDDPRRLIDLGDRLRRAMIAYVRPDLVIFAVKEIASLILREAAVLNGMADAPRIPALLGRGLSDNCTLRFHQDLARLRAQLVTSGIVFNMTPMLDDSRIRDFLRRYGHQTTSWDIMIPTLGEQPERLLDLLRLSGSERPDPHEQSWPDIAQEQGRILAQLGQTAWQRTLADEACEIMRSFMSIDEEHHFHTGLIIPVTRRLVLKIGETLRQRGVIRDAAEVFWLTDGELRETFLSGDRRSKLPLIRQRELAWRQACRRGPPKLARASDEAATHSDSDGLSGLGVSAGVARGRVRKIGGLADLVDLQPEEILVVRAPDPTLACTFGKIAGLVAETGALLSHGAVAAREYHLPAVFGCRDAFSTFVDGELIEIDGTRGTILRREPPVT